MAAAVRDVQEVLEGLACLVKKVSQPFEFIMRGERLRRSTVGVGVGVFVQVDSTKRGRRV